MSKDALSSPFNGDMKSAPGPKEGNNEWDAASLKCSPATLSTPHMEGVISFHEGEQMLSVNTEVTLPHGKATESSPFHGDFRPGVDSSKK